MLIESIENCSECEGQGIIAIPCEKCTGRVSTCYTKEQLRCRDCDGYGHFLYACQRCEGSGICENEPVASTLLEECLDERPTGNDNDGEVTRTSFI